MNDVKDTLNAKRDVIKDMLREATNPSLLYLQFLSHFQSCKHKSCHVKDIVKMSIKKTLEEKISDSNDYQQKEMSE